MMDSHVKFHSAIGKRPVLIVDDEAINRELLSVILQDNYELIFASTGAKAVGYAPLARICERARDIVRDSGGIVCRREADTFPVYCPHRSDYAAMLPGR